ncbi:MAG: DEAD/DEAH box helicase [Bacteroidales bacterium]|nr:DEAD/DEAH box helicase [Bacteroidales bacterium]
MRKEDIEKVEQQVMNQLKDFQKATVERVDYLFRHNQDRVLVADEVGLGKTMIAKGVIAKMAKLRKEEGDDVFKVVYVCSNQSIANQNIEKLNIFNQEKDDMGRWRLSMQFYAIQKSEALIKKNDGFVQLMTLTPETSFKQSNGSGTVKERVFLGVILDMMLDGCAALSEEKSLLKRRLHKILIGKWEDAWHKELAEWGPKIKKEFSSESDICKSLANDKVFIDRFKNYLLGNSSDFKSDGAFTSFIRRKFAGISVEILNPDLVIMDEFQRFKFLINTDDENDDVSVLADKFLKQKSDSIADKVRVLLLSATPYKLYSTLDEIGDVNQDDHYQEFKDVVHFLKTTESKKNKFDKVWENYSKSLHELRNNNDAILYLAENVKKAENELYEGMCRTERISVMESKDFINDNSKDVALKIVENDVKSYLDAVKLIRENDIKVKFSLDYIKSCPYILSFMNSYDMKKGVLNYFKSRPDKVNAAKSSLLWLNQTDVKGYKPLEVVNSRLERLKEVVFDGEGSDGPKNPEFLLWVPPSMPYYEFGGVYRRCENFSKVLVFSSWEMVPRMIGSLISYEEECRTIGRLVKKRVREGDQDSVNYFQARRYPADRLNFKQNGVVTLLYPSTALANMYSPDVYENGKPIRMESVERKVRQKVIEALKPIREMFSEKKGDEDTRWYWVAPVLMDGFAVYSEKLKILQCTGVNSGDEISQMMSNLIISPINIKLGKEPKDLEDVLVNMVLGSPAICLFRLLRDNNVAIRTALAFKRYFGSPEKTAIIELANNTRKFDDNYHWQDVLLYCKNGNFQAMVDEYVHLLKMERSMDEAGVLAGIENAFEDALGLSTSTYSVQSFNNFKNEVKGCGETRFGLRTHYGVAFVNVKNDTDNSVTRKDTLRKTFNSPFWPFVLATTSIGQEGLDFHLYCRKIMHWNLPTNPIDLEQREGRINRFKCLAIRQNIAQEYASLVNAGNSEDVWEDMFNLANQYKKSGQSDLVPYWCLGDKQNIKIERVLAHYPISKDQANYERLVKILSLYRLTLGQARQEDLLEYVFREFESTDPLKKMFIDLSPYSRKKR